MRPRGSRNIFLGIGAVLLLTFLYFQQRPVDSQVHDRFTGDLRLMKELDAEINLDLLRSRYDLLNSYDPFVQRQAAIRKIKDSLQTLPSFLSGSGREEMKRLLASQSELLSQKERMLETFKSENAILENSIRYLPVLIAEASVSAGKANDFELRDHLTNLLRDVLLYELTPHSNLAGTLDAEIAQIGRDAAHYPRTTRYRQIEEDLSSVAAHAAKIAATKPQVESLTEALNSLPTANVTEKIFNTYTREYEREQRIGNTYRLFLTYAR